MKLKSLTMAATVAVAALSVAGVAHARDQIQIAGSSTVLPYANIVAEQFGQAFPQFKTPIVESGGSSAGLKQFCSGVGTGYIDIANSSRPIKSDEKEACGVAGVSDIIEVRFGYDGIVFASDVAGPEIAFTPKDWYLALAQKVPSGGKLVPNPNKSWKDVNPALPDWKITALIPGEKHGTREVFEEKVLVAGCKEAGALDIYVAGGVDKKDAEKMCARVRTDGASIDIDGDYTETLGRLQSNKQAIGVFGLSFYENNTDKLRVATMNGVVPSVATISSGQYPVSRPLFFYVKKAHIGVIPGLKEYAEYFVSDAVAGPGGPLAEYGLVPLPAAEAEAVRAALAAEKTL